MNTKQYMQEGTIDRAIISLDPFVAKYPAMKDIANIRRKLVGHQGHIRQFKDEQQVAMIQRSMASIRIAETQKTLRTVHLMQIARQAKPLFRDEPAILNTLRVPPVRATPKEYADAALAMAKALRPHQKFCVAEGFTPGFVKEMTDSAKALLRAAAESDQGRERVSVSTRNLRDAIAAARQDLLIADAILKAHARRLPADQRAPFSNLVEQWGRQIKVGKKVGRPRGRKPPPPSRTAE